MQRLAAVLLLMLPSAPAVAAPRDPAAIRQQLDQAVPAALARHKVPALSLALIRDGRIDVVAAWGQQSAGQPASPASLFNVASLTKPITAEVALRLASAGRIDLDEAMTAHWLDPDIRDHEWRNRLTARLALSHQTGFANWRRQTGGQLRFRFAPGTGYGYSGEGYEYVGRYLQAKAGERLDALAGRLIFAPLAMASTSHTGQPWFAGRIAAPSRDGAPLPPVIAAQPVASDDLYTTAADYAAFLASLIRSDGISPDLARQRATIHADQTREMCNQRAPATCPARAGFGLGWQVLDFAGTRFLMHTGNDRGEFTFAYWSPDTREGGVILTNSNVGGLAIIDALPALGLDPRFAAYLKAVAEK